MTSHRHVSIRTCIGCGERDPRPELVRLVLSSKGELLLDAAGIQPGRGGYLHRRENCWNRFARRGGTIRSFRAPVPTQARTALLDELRVGVDL